MDDADGVVGFSNSFFFADTLITVIHGVEVCGALDIKEFAYDGFCAKAEVDIRGGGVVFDNAVFFEPFHVSDAVAEFIAASVEGRALADDFHK